MTDANRGRIHAAGGAIGEALAWLALAGAMWIYCCRFDGEFSAYLWGPVAWPRAVMVAIAVLALVHLARQRLAVMPDSVVPILLLEVRRADPQHDQAFARAVDTPKAPTC